jgi:hypothetical protein
MKVDFIILGAQKSGTTSLFDILDSHPKLEGCHGKEPHFFSRTEDWKKNFAEYEKLYAQREDALYFEASTSYSFYPRLNLELWNDFKEHNPKMKFIYIVRKPLDRIISHYMHAYERGYTDRNIETELTEDGSYIDRTRYYTQIKPYVDTFGIDNVLLLDFKDFIKNRDKVIKEIGAFLGIDMQLLPEQENVHSNASIGGGKTNVKYENPGFAMKVIRKVTPGLYDKITDNSERRFESKPKLTPKFERMIARMLEMEIDALEGLFKKDFSDWT